MGISMGLTKIHLGWALFSGAGFQMWRRDGLFLHPAENFTRHGVRAALHRVRLTGNVGGRHARLFCHGAHARPGGKCQPLDGSISHGPGPPKQFIYN